MSNNLVAESVQAIRASATSDPETEAECVEFIRAAITAANRQTALDIKNLLAEVCDSGYADRTQIWADLTPIERQ